jgi:WD40 repeat protein
MTPSVLAFDCQSRLIAHDAQGLRVWPAGATSAQRAPLFKPALPRITATGWPMILISGTSDGRKLALVRASDVFLWNADSPDQVSPVIPPPGWRTVSSPPATKAARPGGVAGAEAMARPFRGVQIAPDGDRIYLLEQGQGQGNALHVWSLAKPADASPIQAHEMPFDPRLADGAIRLALRSDGALLAVGERSAAISLIDTRTFTRVGKIDGPNGGDSENIGLAMTFAPDGQTLAIGSNVGTISLWSVADPKKPKPRIHLPGHRGSTAHLVFDTCGRRLASAGWTDPLIEIWDLDLIGRELTRLGLAD